MRREQILEYLGYSFPAQFAKRVIVCTDAHNEADDQFAIVHHLLTPCENVLGVVASHYEYMTNMMIGKAREMGWSEERLQKHLVSLQFAPLRGSMELSYGEIRRVMSLMDVDDVPVLRGAIGPLASLSGNEENEGVDIIIREARKRDSGRLYVCFLGAITDMALALRKAPDIADNVTVIWIGGGRYPEGGNEYNIGQDVDAANTGTRRE